MSDPDAPRPPRESGAAPASISRTILDWLRSLGGLRGDDLTLRKSLEVLLDDYADEGQPINPDERLMLMNILKLSELEVDDVMVPRAGIVAVDAAAAYDGVIEIFRKEFHSRMPVYRETLDEVLGAVYVKDLVVLAGDPQGFDLAAIARPVLYVPPSMPVLALLPEMRTSRIHMAVGGTDGLVTIEDLVEEIVGEIEDEHDRVEAPLLVEGPEGSLEADGAGAHRRARGQARHRAPRQRSRRGYRDPRRAALFPGRSCAAAGRARAPSEPGRVRGRRRRRAARQAGQGARRSGPNGIGPKLGLAARIGP